MKRYRITYKDCGEFVTEYRNALDAFDAQEKFWDSIENWQGDTLGIELVEITRVKN